MTKKQFKEITQWQKATFKGATPLSKFEHLLQELEELGVELRKDSPHRRHEYADCFILLFGMAESNGMTYEDICQAIDEKMSINYRRKWGSPTKDGVVNHIK